MKLLLVALIIPIASVATRAWAQSCGELVRVAADFAAEVELGNDFWSAVSAATLDQQLSPPASTFAVKAPTRVFSLDIDQTPWPLMRNPRTPALYVYHQKGILYSPTRLMTLVKEKGFDSYEAFLRLAVAQEFGHHLQNMLGLYKIRYTTDGVNLDREHAYRMELMADCLAGFYLRRRGLVAREIMPVVAAIGSEHSSAEAVRAKLLQMNEVYPSPFQRVKWFMNGWAATELRECQTLTPPLAELI